MSIGVLPSVNDLILDQKVVGRGIGNCLDGFDRIINYYRRLSMDNYLVK
jgi:hypothetical protein